jgi:hypothetical protein
MGWVSVSKNRGIAFSDFCVHGFLSIAVNPSFLFLWNIGIGENGVNRAFWDASAAINALVRVDDKVRFSFSEGFNRANGNAFLVLVVNASGSYDVGHVNSSVYALEMFYLTSCQQ